MVTKSELEREPLTRLTILCLQQGLDPTGDKETLIARLLGKPKPEPAPDELAAELEPEPEREPLTRLTILCLQQGLDPTGDKETLIARLLGKPKPEPAPDELAAELEPEPEPET